MMRDDDLRCGGADGGKSPSSNGNGEDESARSTDETPPAPCAALCGPRACATLPPNLSQPAEPKRRRLWGLRGLVKMFRRRVRRRAEEGDSPQPTQPTLRARSTSELAVDNPLSLRSTGPYNQGLSVSHDSVFSPDTPTDTHGHGTPPALALATRGVNMAELKAALRRRRCDDSGSGDEDPGLPRSPPTSPTTLDVLNHGLKSSSRATQSTCSDGSLLSMGSSENDEDSLGASSHHSSKASLIDGRHQVVDHEPMAGAAPLSHTAARHKIAVRPRRTYGAPRARRNTQVVGQLSLPTTPEVNEDSSVKSMTPPVHHPITSSASVGIPKSSSQGKVEADDPSSTSSSCSASSSGGVDGGGISPTKEKRRSSRERRTSLDRRDSDKGKRDEPFFQRLFGSVRSGRRRSKGDGDSREGSVSPMRREEETRSSRDKRRDSSGNRLPVMSRSSARQRHEAHLLPPTPDSASRHRDVEGRGRGRDNNEDRLAVSHHTQRSASVEGRVEGFHITSVHQQNIHTNFQIASYEDKIRHDGEPEARPVKKANSFREQMMPVRRKEYSRRSWMVQDEHGNEVFDESQVSQKASRLSASFDHLEETSPHVNQQLSYRSESSLLSSESTRNMNKRHQTKDPSVVTSGDIVGIPPPSAFSLSPLSFSASKNDQDFGTGPLSLDSSISSRTSGEEDRIKKSTSVDYLGRTLQPINVRVSGDEEEAYLKEREEFPVDFNAQRKSRSIDEGRDFLGDSRSPQAVKRSASHRKSFPRQESESTEQMETDYPLVALRSLKKEPSVKKITPPAGESDNLPEFLRIQLNKVESKGNTTTIFDTENEDTDYPLPRVEPLPLSTSPSLGEIAAFESARVHKHPRLYHAASEDGVIDSKRNSDDSFSLSSREATLKREKSSGSLRDEKSPETTVDRVVLRKPLVHERTNVLERSSSVTSQQSSAGTSEEPELFKVFARRSFKLKDSDKEKTNATSSDEEHEAEVDKGEISVESAMGVPTALVKGTAPAVSESIQQRPLLNSISFNRMSVGNPAVAFKPPHMIKNTSIASNTSPKLNLVIISSSPNTSTTGSVFNMGEPVVPCSPMASTTATTTTITSSSSSSSISFSHSNTSKPILTSRSSVIWPPVTQQETQEEVRESQPATTSPSSSTSVANSQMPRLSNSDQERTPLKTSDSHHPIEVTPLNIGAARRKFQSGSGGRADRPSTPEKTSPTPPPTTPSGPALVSLKTTTSTTSLTSTPSKSPSSSYTEMQNSSPNFTVTVRSHSQGGGRLSGNIFSSTPSKEESTPCAAEQTGSVTSSEQQHHVGVEEDWRVLARQRREDRLKQSKNPETQDIIIETRPAVSRNSKVLEMASNFQKLQVA